MMITPDAVTLNLAEATAYLKCSRSFLYNKIAEGVFPKGTRLGRRVVWFRESLDKCLDNLRIQSEKNLKRRGR